MKILMINKFLHPNGGSETYIFKLGQKLTELGHEVQYFGMDHPDRIVGNHAESYTASMDFHTGKLQKLLYPFRIIYSLEARRKLKIVLEDFQPDAIHLNNFNFQLTPSILYGINAYQRKSRKNVVLVYTPHDSQLVCPNHLLRIPSSGELCKRCIDGKAGYCTKYRCIHNSLVKSLLGTIEAYTYRIWKAYRFIDRVICPSYFVEDVLSHNPMLAGKTVVMHNFIDVGGNDKNRAGQKEGARKASQEKLELPDDYVLYFGRYSEEKGIDMLLEACGNLSHIPFVFAGGGPMEKEVDGVPNVKNMGFLSGQALEDAIRKARFVVFPSQCYENCPFSVMEALAYGTPVIGTGIGGTPELVKDGENGELFPEGDVKEMENRIGALWDNKERCRQYAENCQKCVFDSLEEYCGKLIKIYKGKRC